MSFLVTSKSRHALLHAVPLNRFRGLESQYYFRGEVPVGKKLWLFWNYFISFCKVSCPEVSFKSSRNEIESERNERINKLFFGKARQEDAYSTVVEKNVAQFRELGFEDSKILRILSVNPKLRTIDKSHAIQMAANFLKDFRIDISRFSPKFYQSVDYIAEGKSAEILQFLFNELNLKITPSLLPENGKFLLWNVPDVKKVVELFDSFGAQLAAKQLFSKTGPMCLTYDTIKRKADILLSRVGEKPAQRVLERSMKVLGQSEESLGDILGHLQQTFGTNATSEMILKYPYVLLANPSNFQPVLLGLSKIFGQEKSLQILRKCPRLMILDWETDIASKMDCFVNVLGTNGGKTVSRSSTENRMKMILMQPSLIMSSRPFQVSLELVNYFGEENFLKMLEKNPKVVSLNWETNLKPKIDTLVNEWGRSKAELVDEPLCLLYSLEKRIRPRFEAVLSKKGLVHRRINKLRMSDILYPSAEKFKLLMVDRQYPVEKGQRRT